MVYREVQPNFFLIKYEQKLSIHRKLFIYFNLHIVKWYATKAYLASPQKEENKNVHIKSS